MRMFILFLLAGGTLYYAWGQLGGDDSSESGEASAAEVEFPEDVGSGMGGAFMSMDDPREEPEPAKASPDPVVEVVQSPGGSEDPFDLNALGDPLFEGSLLLHRPDDLQQYLKGAGEGLSSTRKKLLISYLLLSRGQYGQVSTYANGLDEAQDVTPEEYQLLTRARGQQKVGIRDAASKPHRSPLVLGVSMALLEREADEAAIAAEWGKASELLSELLLMELDAPWEPDQATLKRWAAGLEDAQKSHRWSPEGNWPGIDVTVEPGDTLVGIRKHLIAERPSLVICTGLIHRSNRLGRYLREGDPLRVPTDRVRTIIDLSARWLYYLHGNEVVAAWPVAIGREGQETTPGRYQVGEKTPEPPWFPRGQQMVPYGDDENPLGTRWITLEGSDSLGIHGTWAPETIGTKASDGCVRLRNEDVEELFEVIPRGTEVWVRP